MFSTTGFCHCRGAAAKRQAFNRDLKKAADEELVGVRDKLVWLVAPEDEADVGLTRGDIDWDKMELRDALRDNVPMSRVGLVSGEP